MADDEVFSGFPTCLDDGFTPFPNAWFDIIMQIDNVAELKVVLYVARHTWGYQDRDGERERSKKIALDEFAHGRKRRNGSRIDGGTRLAMSTIQEGLKKAIAHEYLIFTADYSDLGRVKKYYGLKLIEEDEENEELDYRIPVVDYRDPAMNNRNPARQNSDSGSPTEKETQGEKPQKETVREETALDAQTLTLINKTLQYIEKKESITFLQLEQYLHRYMDTVGKEDIRHVCKNLIVWTQISNEFFQFVLQLQATKRITFSMVDENLYPANKKRPQLPVAREAVDHNELHWTPLVIRLKPNS